MPIAKIYNLQKKFVGSQLMNKIAKYFDKSYFCDENMH